MIKAIADPRMLPGLGRLLMVYLNLLALSLTPTELLLNMVDVDI